MACSLGRSNAHSSGIYRHSSNLGTMKVKALIKLTSGADASYLHLIAKTLLGKKAYSINNTTQKNAGNKANEAC